MLPRYVEGGWLIGGFAYAENPRFTVPAWCERLVMTWARMRRLRGGGGALGMPGAAIMPQAGGYADQTGLVMDAFELFDHWAEQRRDDRGHTDA